MTPREIKAELILKGITHLELARRAKVDPSMITRVIQYQRKSYKVRWVIARAIGKPWQEIFTDDAVCPQAG
jgi:lambda repressor-like predicted transcriptional regulator